jgi:hypothetical protein
MTPPRIDLEVELDLDRRPGRDARLEVELDLDPAPDRVVGLDRDLDLGRDVEVDRR